MAARFYGATQLRVQGFDCVRGVDDPTDRDGERKERDDLGPIAPPALGDRGIFAPPRADIERVERRLAGFGVLCAIDRPQFAGDRLAVLPGGELHGMADQMHDAGLHHGVWKDGVDRLRKARSPSTTAMRISSMPRFLSSFITRSQ